MAKDPAALFYIAKWLVATKGMKADCRGWFLNLILHQFDKGELPNDIEELANYADVRVSEYERFQQVWQQVLQHKFKQNSNGDLENGIAKEIIKGREQFKDKRSEAGKMSVFVKYIRANLCADENVIQFIKKNTDLSGVDVSDQHMLKQVFEQKHQLYINVNINKDKGIKEGVTGETIPVSIIPVMEQEFKASNPNYLYDQQKDFPALRSIAEQILKWENLPGDITTSKNSDRIKRRWGEVVPFIRAEPFFAGYSLRQIDTHFQSIVQKFNSRYVKQGTTQVGKSFVSD